MNHKLFLLEINKNKCIKCSKCVNICVSEALYINKELEWNEDKCIRCSHCLSICPVDAININNEKIEKLQTLKIKNNDFKNLILNRRSIRNYNDKIIRNEIIYEIADSLRYSPTASNTQDVYVTAINDRKKIKILSDQVAQYYYKLTFILNKITFHFFKIILGIPIARKLLNIKNAVKDYFEGKNKITYNAPALLVFHSPPTQLPETDCVHASTIVMLYAESFGLSTCLNGYITQALKRSSKLKKVIGIPNNHSVHSSIMLGYSDIVFKNKVVREKDKVTLL